MAKATNIASNKGSKSVSSKVTAKPSKGSSSKKTVGVLKSKGSAIAATAKAVSAADSRKKDKADKSSWSTIHVFGFGKSQIIGTEVNSIVENAELKSLEALLSSLAGIQQKGTKITLDGLHSIHISNGLFVDFRPRSFEKNKPQRFEWVAIDKKVVNTFANEITKKVVNNVGSVAEKLSSLKTVERPAIIDKINTRPAKKAVIKLPLVNNDKKKNVREKIARTITTIENNIPMMQKTREKLFDRLKITPNTDVKNQSSKKKNTKKDTKS